MLLSFIEGDSHEHYRLLIHSLTHEHAQSHGERHLLILQKWMRDNHDGIILQDLEHVTEILRIVKGFLSSNAKTFKPIVQLILALCCKPLLESKANERLRPKGMADMKLFYKAIAAFCIDADNELKRAVVHCFRCIVGGGNDPLVLRVEAVASKVKKNKVAVTDIAFLQSLIRDSAIIDFIVLEFLESVDILEKDFKDFTESSLLFSRGPRQSSGTTKQKSLRETLREYGIPDDYKAEECSEEEKFLYIEKGNEDDVILVDDCGIEKRTEGVVVTLPMINAQKSAVSQREQLTADIVELCAELARDDVSAGIMSSMRTCDGVIKFLNFLRKENMRDKRINSLIDLLWTLLESFLHQLKDNHDANSMHDNTSAVIDFSGIIDQEPAVQVLHGLIISYAQEGFRNSDKECRNEVLNVLTLLAESSSSHSAFLEIGLFNDVLYFACYAECSSFSGMFPEWLDQHPQSSSNPRNFGTNSEIDLQFKRGLWILISDLLQHDNLAALSCVSQSPLLLSLLLYLEFDTLPLNNQRVHTPAGSTQGDFIDLGGAGVGAGSDTFRASGILFESVSRQRSDTADSEDQEGRALSPEGPEEEPFPDRFSLTRESEDTYKNKRVRTTGKTFTSDVKNFTGGIVEDRSFLAGIPLVQMLQLQVLAVTLLADIGSKLVDAFMSIDGPLRVYDVAMHYCNSDVEGHVNVVGTVLILLNRLLVVSDAVRGVLETQDTVQLCLYAFERSEEDHTKAQAIRSISLLCTSTLCQSRLRELEGIQFLVFALKRCVTSRRVLVGLKAGIKIADKHTLDKNDPCLLPLAGDVSDYVVALLDCLSKAVVGNRLSQSQLAKDDGIDVLLELLEVSPYVLRLPVLRLLSDLLDNTELAGYARAWKSPRTMRSAVQLATHCWLDEEVRLGGVRSNGIISNILDPLGSHNDNDPSPGVGTGTVVGTGVGISMELIPLPNMSVSTASSGTETSRSLAVSRLSAAILQSRFSDSIPLGNVPLNMRHSALENDTRGLVASVLQLLGTFDFVSILKGGEGQHNTNTDMSVIMDGLNDPSVASCTPEGEQSGREFEQESDRIDEKACRSRVPFSESLGPGATPSRSPFSPNRSSMMDAYTVTSEEMRVLQNEQDMSLSVAEKQVVAMARRYAVLREGSAWVSVSESLRIAGVEPIDSDMAMLSAKMDDYFKTAQMVRMEQTILRDIQDVTAQITEKTFLNQIASRRSQEIKMANQKTGRAVTAKGSDSRLA